MKKMPTKIIFTVCGVLAGLGIVFCIAGAALGAGTDDVQQLKVDDRLKKFWYTVEEKMDVFDSKKLNHRKVICIFLSVKMFPLWMWSWIWGSFRLLRKTRMRFVWK